MDFLRFKSERDQIQLKFSPELLFMNLHEQIDELLQALFGIVLFVFQKYIAKMLSILFLYAFIQIYLCYFFAGKYSALITATKSFYSLCFLFFIVTANSAYNQIRVEDQFLNINVAILIGLKLVSTSTAVIVSLSLERKFKNQKKSDLATNNCEST